MPDGTNHIRPSLSDAPRSIWVGPRQTTLRLEPEYWSALEAIANDRRLSIWTVLEQIERQYGRKRFTSRVRVYCLSYFRGIR